MGASSFVHLEVEEVVKETDKAILVRLDNGNALWIPLSVISDSSDYKEGDVNCTISILEWFAKKEGLGGE